ncbi:hypothetical protein, partial [Vibrio parahaemolyticus]|uniref:hypothetical protein n=1 Tax=Vibrio parahaemolyticus TaxID=670 RepID=UPI001E500A0F
GAVSKRLSLKPLGTHNALENGLSNLRALLEKQCYRASFQQVNRLLIQKTQTTQETKAQFSQTQLARN